MQSLPIAEKGSNKGQIDQSQMTPEQNIKFFEYQYGQDKATQAATKMVDNLKKRIKKGDVPCWMSEKAKAMFTK